MRVGILSDTHDQVARARAAVLLLLDAGAEVLVHCGDITAPAVVAELAGLPSYWVFGNCDDDRAALRQAFQAIGGTCLESGGTIELAGRRLAVTHGHLDREIRRLLAEGPDYLFTGHTHQARDERAEATRWINPGALSRASEHTVALLDLARDDLRTLPVRNTVSRGGNTRA